VSTSTLERPPARRTSPEPRNGRGSSALSALRRNWRAASALGVLVVWVLAWALFKDHFTLTIGGSARTPVFDWLRDRSNWVEETASSGTNPVINFAGWVADLVDSVFGWLQGIFTVAHFPRPLPQVGWLGTIAIAALVAYAAAGWRTLALVVPCFFAFGILGYWNDAIDLLIVTFFAVVVSCVFGIAVGVVMAHSRRFSAIITPVLDVMQTMPSFTYLLPFSILFGIGPAAAVMMTLVYAAPPVIRITAHGIRAVSGPTCSRRPTRSARPAPAAVERRAPDGQAHDHRGYQPDDDGGALDGDHRGVHRQPGPGPAGPRRPEARPARHVVRRRHRDRDHGDHARPVDDRREPVSAPSSRRAPVRRVARSAGSAWGLAGVGTRVALYLSHSYVWANEFPSQPDLGTPLRNAVDSFGEWLRTDLSNWLTGAIQRGRHRLRAQPDPEPARGLAVVRHLGRDPRDRRRVGGRKAVISTVLCLAGISASACGTTRWRRSPCLPRRHDRGDHPGRRARRADGPEPPRRRGPPAVPRRRPDDPAVRLPGAGPGLFSQPVHRDRRGCRLRRPGRDQAGRRRHPRGLAHHVEAAAPPAPRLADDHEGPAADGPQLAGAGHQPGPALRAVDGRHRRHGRRRRLGYDVVSGFSQASCSARASPPASTIVLLGSCSTGSRRTAAHGRSSPASRA
jgi:glycine betaine/proline transport system permease protein